jgi:transcriptional regulator with XRE-family HTH domain
MQDKQEHSTYNPEHSYETLPILIKMARAALGLGIRDLARISGMAPDTIARLERGDELKRATIAQIRTALEDAGVEFIAGSNGGVGVLLKKK